MDAGVDGLDVVDRPRGQDVRVGERLDGRGRRLPVPQLGAQFVTVGGQRLRGRAVFGEEGGPFVPVQQAAGQIGAERPGAVLPRPHRERVRRERVRDRDGGPLLLGADEQVLARAQARDPDKPPGPAVVADGDRQHRHQVAQLERVDRHLAHGAREAAPR